MKKISSSSKYLSVYLLAISCMVVFLYSGCNQRPSADTAFYYWKQSFEISLPQKNLLTETHTTALYLRFFDIKWNAATAQAYPEAIVSFKDTLPHHLSIIPVIYITNQTFEKLDSTKVDSLAIRSHQLLEQLAAAQRINYQTVQIDCDWSISTKAKYFKYLSTFKKLSKKQLSATIRLHQVKYQVRTGVPPTDRGVLMFYNMGKLTADLSARNSIYNPQDAATYISYLPKYLLPLDIALPLFSWSVHIRDGKVIQIYGKIGKRDLTNTAYFKPTDRPDVYQALKSFFTGGIYVKENDYFKLEEVHKTTLDEAVKQLSANINKKKKRNIIYYELSNLDLSEFNAKDLQEVSAHF